MTTYRDSGVDIDAGDEFVDRIKPLGMIEKFPRVQVWAQALLKRPSTHSFPEGEFEAMYRLNVKLRNKYLSQFVADQAVQPLGAVGALQQSIAAYAARHAGTAADLDEQLEASSVQHLLDEEAR